MSGQDKSNPTRTWRVRWGTGIFFVLILVVTMVVPGSRQEPMHQGKTVSNWLRQPAPLGDEDAAMVALRKMGAEAVPYKIRALARTDSVFDRGYRIIYAELPPWAQKWLRKPVELGLWRDRVYMSLGNDVHARQHLPEIMQLLKHRDQQVRAMTIVIVGGLIQPEDTYCVTLLGESLSDSDESVRRLAAEYLGRFGSAAKAACPALHHCLTDNSAMVRIAAAWAVSQIETDNLPLVASVLKEAMTNESQLARVYAAQRFLEISDSSAPDAIRVLVTSTFADPKQSGRVQEELARILSRAVLVDLGVQKANVVIELERLASLDQDDRMRGVSGSILQSISTRKRQLQHVSKE